MKWQLPHITLGQLFEYGLPLWMGGLVLFVYGWDYSIPLRLFFAVIVAVMTWMLTAMARWSVIWFSKSLQNKK